MTNPSARFRARSLHDKTADERPAADREFKP